MPVVVVSTFPGGEWESVGMGGRGQSLFVTVISINFNAVLLFLTRYALQNNYFWWYGNDEPIGFQGRYFSFEESTENNYV